MFIDFKFSTVTIKISDYLDPWWHHGQCARLRIEWSGFKPWPGSLFCVLRQDTLLSQCFTSPRCTNGYLASHPRGEQQYSQLRKLELSAGLIGHLGQCKGFTIQLNLVNLTCFDGVSWTLFALHVSYQEERVSGTNQRLFTEFP